MRAATPSWRSPRNLLRLSVVVALATIALKMLAWWLTGSVALLSDALESFVNLASAMFALQMVTVAARPANDAHPYGHYKAEYFSAGFEGIMIIGAALGIIFSATYRWLNLEPLVQIDTGIMLSVASSVLNGALAYVMLQSAKLYRSAALEGDAKHLLTDVWTSVGVVIGLLLVVATGWMWLDVVVAIAVALNILREGGKLVWKSSLALMDVAVPQDVQAQIDAVLADFAQSPDTTDIIRFDHVTTRQAGPRSFVDMHMHMPANWTLGRAAALRGDVERALVHAVPGLLPTIQLLPSDVETYTHISHPES
ncbi:cation diffusion facilitator family transporter [Comamonadaceae bacterium M7527]|nr:cation diffusion facilitator family transporter [Comamonadaceae bacterium M7527]